MEAFEGRRLRGMNDRTDGGELAGYAQQLERIQIPADLTGMAVLAIGCGDGFFAAVAAERGARRILGVDIDEAALASARVRVPDAEFLLRSWWDIPAERFDLILFLSGLHREPQPKRLLQSISMRLAPNGLLILECGVVRDGTQRKDWRPTQRRDKIVSYPSFTLLMDEILADYAVRDIGPGVVLAGDGVPRSVFHCTLAKPTILAIGGASGTGKSNLARVFAREGTVVIHTDYLLGAWAINRTRLQHEFLSYVAQKLRPNAIDFFLREMIQDGKTDEYCSLLLKHVSLDDRVTILEGYGFSLPEIRETFRRAAEAAGFRVAFCIL
jgi:SAM-dependent methyltransferase